CADEVVAKLVLRGENGEGPFVVLQGLAEHQREAVEHVLKHRHLAVAALLEQPEQPAVLGCADPDTRLAFGSVCEAGPADEELLAARLGWARERAAQALAALASLRLARCHDGSFHPVPVR